jgi:hypothetical protein
VVETTNTSPQVKIDWPSELTNELHYPKHSIFTISPWKEALDRLRTQDHAHIKYRLVKTEPRNFPIFEVIVTKVCMPADRAATMSATHSIARCVRNLIQHFQLSNPMFDPGLRGFVLDRLEGSDLVFAQHPQRALQHTDMRAAVPKLLCQGEPTTEPGLFRNIWGRDATISAQVYAFKNSFVNAMQLV